MHPLAWAALGVLLLAACGGGSPAAPPIGGPPAAPPELLIIGDSHARRWGEQANAAQLFPGWRVRYAGIGSQTSAQVAARFDAEALAQRADVVVILCGTNDVWYLSGAANVGELRAMAWRARAAGRRVVLFRIPRITDPAPAPSGSSDVRPWNAALDALALELRADVLDGYALSLSAGLMLPDGVHFNADGYARLTAELGRLLD